MRMRVAILYDVDKLKFMFVSSKSLFICRMCLFPLALSTSLSKVLDHYARYDEEETETSNVCTTKECYQISKEFLASINKSTDPCDNFYAFACGGWAAKDPVPKFLPGWNRLSMFQLAVQQRIKGNTS